MKICVAFEFIYGFRKRIDLCGECVPQTQKLINPGDICVRDKNRKSVVCSRQMAKLRGEGNRCIGTDVQYQQQNENPSSIVSN